MIDIEFVREYIPERQKVAETPTMYNHTKIAICPRCEGTGEETRIGPSEYEIAPDKCALCNGNGKMIKETTFRRTEEIW